MEKQLVEQVLNNVSPNIRFKREDFIQAVQEAGSTKSVGILYSHKGDRFLAIGQRSENVEVRGASFKVDRIVGVEGNFNGYDALDITSIFAGVKITCKYGEVVNEVYNSPSLFTNENALYYALQLAAGEI